MVVVVGGGSGASVVVVVVGAVVAGVVSAGSEVPAIGDADPSAGRVEVGADGDRRGTVVAGALRAGGGDTGSAGSEVPPPFMKASLAARWRDSSISSIRPRPSQYSRSRPSSIPSEDHRLASSASPM